MRYADDGRIYVHSRRAGERVMESITQYVEQRLKLRVNREKSVVARSVRRPLLGFGFFYRDGEAKVRVDPKRLKRAKDTACASSPRVTAASRWSGGSMRSIASRSGGRRTSRSPHALPIQQLDQWLRRRLRQVRWKQWKRVRTKRRKLIALGIPADEAHKCACSRKGSWRNSSSRILHQALPTAYWTDHGLQGFAEPYRRFRDAKRTARCGPACRVVWGAPG